MGYGAGKAHGRPERDRACLALGGRAVRLERQRGWHVFDLDGEGVGGLLPCIFIGSRQLDQETAAGRERVGIGAGARNGARELGLGPVYL